MRARDAMGAFLLALSFAAPVRAQQQTATLRIRVTDAGTDDVIVGALVGFPELELFALTNVEGVALLTAIPPGDHELAVSMFGYGPATALLHLEPRAVATGDVALSVAPIEIAGIEVEGRSRWSRWLDRRGFYDREQRGFGTQVDRTEIERINAFFPSDLLRRTPGMMQAAFNTFRGGACTPRVYVDGIEWDGEMDDIPITWIEGIELYPRLAGAPVEYTGLGRTTLCGGLVLIWLG